MIVFCCEGRNVIGAGMVWKVMFLWHSSDMPNGDNPMVVQLRTLASNVLFALSQNNFNAVFNKISARWEQMITVKIKCSL